MLKLFVALSSTHKLLHNYFNDLTKIDTLVQLFFPCNFYFICIWIYILAFTNLKLIQISYQNRININKKYLILSLISTGMNSFAEGSKNLARYRSKNNFVKLSK